MKLLEHIFYWGTGTIFIAAGISASFKPAYPERPIEYNALVAVLSLSFGGFLVWRWFLNRKTERLARENSRAH